MFDILDDLRVFYKSTQIASTGGSVANGGSLSFDWKPPPSGSPTDHVIDVVVKGGTAPPNIIALIFNVNPGETQWVYRVACPA